MTGRATQVLLTGGAGFIGSGVATRLVEAGVDVTVVDVLHPQVHADDGRPTSLPDAVTFLPFDVTTPTTWDALLRLHRPDVVVHLAAETGTGQSLREGSRHCHANVLGTSQMLDAFTRAEFVPKHIVVPSSRAVYGEGEWELDGQRYLPGTRRHEDLAAARWDPPSEDGRAGHALPSRARLTPPTPTSVYGATKLAQEHICTAWAAAMGSAVSILRFQNVYGVGQSLTNPYTGVLTLFTRLAVAGNLIEVYEDGQILRDFVYIDDVVDAVIRTIDRPPADVRRVDIGSGAPRTLLSVAEMIAGITGAKRPVVTGAFRDGDVRAACCSIEDARERARLRADAIAGGRSARRRDLDLRDREPSPGMSRIKTRELIPDDGIGLYLIERLGNQLFMYAAALEQARRLDCPLYLNLAYYRRRPKPNRPYSLDAFDHGMIVRDDPREDPLLYRGYPLLRVARPWYQYVRPSLLGGRGKVFVERSFRYDDDDRHDRAWHDVAGVLPVLALLPERRR